jgi:hypothetical protein
LEHGTGKTEIRQRAQCLALAKSPPDRVFSPGFKGTAGRFGGVNKEKQQANQTRPFFHKYIIKYPK